MRQLSGHRNMVISIKFNRDASRIASGSYDKTIRIWDVVSCSQIMLMVGHTSNILCFRLASTSDDNSVMVWDVASGVCVWLC